MGGEQRAGRGAVLGVGEPGQPGQGVGAERRIDVDLGAVRFVFHVEHPPDPVDFEGDESGSGGQDAHTGLVDGDGGPAAGGVVADLVGGLARPVGAGLRLRRHVAPAAEAGGERGVRGRGGVGEGGGERGEGEGARGVRGVLGEGGEVAVVEAGVEAGGGELRVPQGPYEEFAVGGQPVDPGFGEGPGEGADGLGAGRGVGDDLGEHGVVVDADGVPVGEAGVHADPAGDGEGAQDAGLRAPVPGGVLGVEAGLDGVPAWLGRRRGQRRALGHTQLEGDEVEAEDGLGDGVFHLEAGVHLQEVRAAVGGDEEFDGAGAPVGDGAGGGRGGLVEALAQGVREAGRRGLLDDLLVAPLEGAVAGAERPDGAVGVGEDLHLDVAAALDVGLREDLPVAERGAGLGGRGLQLLLQRVEVAYDAHAAAAAARGGLEEQGQVGGGGGRRVDGVEERDPGGAHEFLGAGLGGHGLDRLGGGPIQARPASSTARAKPAFSDRNP
ncbi:hypothetical protein GCM10020254_47930 [Streptomyces goshikiensis]